MTQATATVQGNSAFPAATSQAIDAVKLDSIGVQAHLPELSVAPPNGLGVLAEIAWQAASISTSGAGIQSLVERAAGNAALDIPMQSLENAAQPVSEGERSRSLPQLSAQAA